MAIKIVVRDNKTCAVVDINNYGVEVMAVEGLTPEQATLMQMLCKTCFERGQRAVNVCLTYKQEAFS